ncbi:hypothetical protein [Burkholderia cepacia]|uniref:hypothetical protein n=1 Tax=Burkholderia cepacia TaxID=292 RepID=UPI002AAFEFDE|nr:hypothetical protein [Burkholderia cepacia]
MENPDSFRAITPVRQDLFPWTFRDELSWVEPYYALRRSPPAGDHRAAPPVQRMAAT